MRRSTRMMKQKRNTSSASSNPSIIDLSEPHHACKLAKGTKWRFEDKFVWARGRCRSKRLLKCRFAAPPMLGKLDSTLFHNHFRIIWDKFPEDKRALFAYVDCLWFAIYYEPTSREKVLSWIKKAPIFSKKYVIIPIVLWGHWNLLLLCNFDKSLESSTRKPCMLLLDSLANAGSMKYQTLIIKFVGDVFQALGRPETKKMISKIPFVVPKVPQQINEVECGNFVLYFIQLFVNAAPKAFDISNGHPDFMNETWFGRESYENFCNQLNIAL